MYVCIYYVCILYIVYILYIGISDRDVINLCMYVLCVYFIYCMHACIYMPYWAKILNNMILCQYIVLLA